MIADSTAYVTVYDATVPCLPNLAVLKPAAIIFLAGALLVALPLPHGRLRRQAKYTGFLMVLGTVGWSILAGMTSWRAQRELCQELRRGRFTLVEGVVSNFQPALPPKRPVERWDVQSGAHLYHFSYSATDLVGYRQTEPEGGRIREGTRVRVADVGAVIGRLEMAVPDTGRGGAK